MKTHATSPAVDGKTPIRVVMLLSNAYNPDDRVRNEAMTLSAEGYDVIILAWDRDCRWPQQAVEDGIEIRRLHLRAGYEQGFKQGLAFVRLWQGFIKEMSVLRPTIVHCHDFDTFIAGLCYRLYDREVKIVLDTHENYSLMITLSVSAMLGRLIGVLESALTRFAGILIAPCEATVEYYASLGARRTAVVGNWKDPQSFRFPSGVLARQLEAVGARGRLVVTYIGSLSAERSILPLIDAVQQRPWAFLILGGSGGQEAAIRNACKGRTNVYFPGYVPPHDVPLLTAISDVIFYGHEPGHGYARYNAPNKLFEALAAGKAILASDLGGEISEVVRSTGCGLLLLELTAGSIGRGLDTLSDESVRIPMQQNAARAGLGRYNWESAKRRLLDAYVELISGVECR